MTETNYSHIPYLPHTEEERQEMLHAIGVRSFEQLVSHIPADVRAKQLDLAPGLSELELCQHVAGLAAKNTPASQQMSFLGGGSARRYVPAVVPSIISRSEFATAYTPYQPEVSQGSLQIIYEFQTAVCLLTGMEVANASMYDGPTACAEAALMAARLTNRKKVIACGATNPEYRMVTETYVKSCGLTYKEVAADSGVLEASKLSLDDDVAAVIVQYPNYFGCLTDVQAAADVCHKHGALLVVVSEPISLGLLKPPGDLGADIVVGDAQPCGNFLSFGGPSAGYMACRKDFVRQLPGRLAGMTVDNRGNRAFTLTLQTREQHIRRAKATSNICTNQALNALAMLVYLTMIGPQGLKQLASISLNRAHYLADRLSEIDGVELLFKQPCFNEFVISLNRPAAGVLDRLQQRGIIGGINLSRFYPQLKHAILVAVTETNSASELDAYAKQLKLVLSEKEGECESELRLSTV
jgi:glycine dehydrogenase subunit 1